jgi:hypothetical protein
MGVVTPGPMAHRRAEPVTVEDVEGGTMQDAGKRQGLGRLVLKGLAIASALTFLTIVMINACAVYAPATKAQPAGQRPAAAPAPAPAPPSAADPDLDQRTMLAPATKAAPVMRPRPLLAPATKSARVLEPDDFEPAAQQAAPQQQQQQQRGAP